MPDARPGQTGKRPDQKRANKSCTLATATQTRHEHWLTNAEPMLLHRVMCLDLGCDLRARADSNRPEFTMRCSSPFQQFCDASSPALHRCKMKWGSWRNWEIAKGIAPPPLPLPSSLPPPILPQVTEKLGALHKICLQRCPDQRAMPATWRFLADDVGLSNTICTKMITVLTRYRPIVLELI